MNDRPYVVCDASTSLKWVLDDEEAVEQAVALRDHGIDGRFELVAPSLWVYEVTNGLVSASRRTRLSERTARRALELMLRVGVRMVDPEPTDVLSRALRYSLSAYDAAYVALAEALDTTLWTGDITLERATRGRRIRVEWIGNYSSAD